MRFLKLSSLDVSLDLVSKVSQTRSARDRANAEAGAPAAVALEAAVDAPAAGGGGGGGGEPANEGVQAEERRADEVVDRWALFGFIDRNRELRLVLLSN